MLVRDFLIGVKSVLGSVLGVLMIWRVYAEKGVKIISETLRQRFGSADIKPAVLFGLLYSNIMPTWLQPGGLAQDVY